MAMEELKKYENVWKQALEERQTGRLPSNFSYRMMERIRVEAKKQQKRSERKGWGTLIAAVLLLFGICIYFLGFYLDIRLSDYFPLINLEKDSFLFEFYGVIALLALILLGIDYWLRKKYIWK